MGMLWDWFDAGFTIGSGARGGMPEFTSARASIAGHAGVHTGKGE